MKKTFLFILSAIVLTINCCFAQNEKQLRAFGDDMSGTNSYSMTVQAVTSTELLERRSVWGITPNTNTTASTLKLNNFAAFPITLNGAALVAGDMPTNVWVEFIFNVTSLRWEMQKVGGAGGGSGTVTSVGLVGGTGVTILGASPITTSGTFTVVNTSPNQTVTLTPGTGISIGGTYPTFTVTNSSPNVNQTIANTSDATSHTITLSDGGGSFKLVEGSNITITTTGTGSDGIATIASTGGAASSASVTITDNNTLDATVYPTWVSGVGTQTVNISTTGLAYNRADETFLLGNKGAAPDSRFLMESIKNQDNPTRFLITNTSTGDLAEAGFFANVVSDFLDNDITGCKYGQFTMVGPNATFGGNFTFWTNKIIIGAGGCTNGMNVFCDGGNFQIGTRRNTGSFSEDFNTPSILVIGNASAVVGNASTAGNVGIRNASPTAKLHLGVGTATASTAPLKFTTQGTAFLTVPEAGAIEYGTPGIVIQHPSDNLVMGAAAPIGTEKVSIQSATNSSTFTMVSNSNSGTAALAFNRTRNNSGDVVDFGIIGSGFTTSGGLAAAAGFIYNNGTGFNIINDDAADVNFYSGGFAAGNLVVKIRSTGAWLQPSAGTASVAPFKLTTSGTTFLASPAAGALEYGTPGFVMQNDNLLIGGTSLIAGEKLSVQSSANSATQIMLHNTSSGTAAESIFQARNNNNKFTYFGINGSGFTTTGGFVADEAFVYTSSTGMNIMSGAATGRVGIFTGGFADANERVRILSGGNVGIGTTTPVNKVDIEGALTVGATSSGTNTAPSNGLLVDGDVGIGTLAIGTAAKLDVRSINRGVADGTTLSALMTNTATATSNTAFIATVQPTGAATNNIAIKGVCFGGATNGYAGWFDATGSTNNYGLVVESGRVGIATITPTELFQVAGSTYTTSITSVGRVGIGATPSAALHLPAGTTAASSAPLKLTAGTNMTTPEANAVEYDGISLFLTNLRTLRQEIPQIVQSRVSSQFDAAGTTTLANVTGLTASLGAGTYRFEATLHVSTDATGGHKYAIGGTATASSVIYQINSINNTTNAFRLNSRQTALGGSAGEALGTAYYTTITGTITVSVAGTITVQFAQNVATGTSSVLVGSTFVVTQVN